jgi:hypothetical protein
VIHCPNPQTVSHPRGGSFEVCACPRDLDDWWAPVHWMDGDVPMYCHCGPKWQHGDVLIWEGNNHGYYCKACAAPYRDEDGHFLVADCVCCSCGGPAVNDRGVRLYRHVPPIMSPAK